MRAGTMTLLAAALAVAAAAAAGAGPAPSVLGGLEEPSGEGELGFICIKLKLFLRPPIGEFGGINCAPVPCDGSNRWWSPTPRELLPRRRFWPAFGAGEAAGGLEGAPAEAEQVHHGGQAAAEEEGAQ